MDSKAEAARKLRVYGFLLAAGMLITGTLNTIFLKFQNRQWYLCGEGDLRYECVKCPTVEGVRIEGCVPFEQPFFQTFIMFTGELMCLIVFYIMLLTERARARRDDDPLKETVDTSTLNGLGKFLFALPTLCDLTATTLMNIGLIYTTASVYQMLRGCVVVFTGVLSVMFLRRKLWAFHWVAMFFVVAGVAIVGLVSIIMTSGSDGAENAVVGDLLVIVAQVFTATQFVIEEKFLAGYNVPPLQAVGLEGVFGVAILAVAMPIVYFAIGVNQAVGNFFDIRFAFEQFLAFPAIYASALGCVCSISLFNFFGLTITKVMSATSRSTIDAMRTLLVWICSLAFGWETFLWPQIIGFVVLVFGTFMYNEVFHLPYAVGKYLYPQPEDLAREEERARVAGHGGDEHQGLLEPDHKSGGSVQVHPDDVGKYLRDGQDATLSGDL